MGWVPDGDVFLKRDDPYCRVPPPHGPGMRAQSASQAREGPLLAARSVR